VTHKAECVDGNRHDQRRGSLVYHSMITLYHSREGASMWLGARVGTNYPKGTGPDL